METNKPNIEMLALGNIIDGFNAQSIGMPVICQRFLELEGGLKEADMKESIELYKEVMASQITGVNLSLAMLAAYYILAELTLQIKEHLKEVIETTEKADDQSYRGYG